MIDSTTTEKKDKLKNESKYIKKEINYRLKKKEEKEVYEKMEKLERIKDDNTKYCLPIYFFINCSQSFVR